MIGSEANFAALLTPTYSGPYIRRYFGEAWSMHLAFAWDLVRELQPRILVELGVYKGESYFGFCQSVEENALATLCYGIDTWRGDPQTGTYGPEIGAEVEAYNARYSGFSNLLKMTFKQASSQFGTGSIDLLHIDGAHGYEDIKEDFETWLPKVSDRGIILFHDVMVRNHGFGVWRLWLEVAQTQPSFVFEFGHGLGVWKKNAVCEDDPPLIRKLFSATGREREEIVRHYAIAAAAIDLKAKATKPSRATSRVQVFAPRYGAYMENHSSMAEIPIGAWHRVRVDLPWSLGDGSGGLRLDPGNEVAIIDIAGILLQSKLTGKVVWRARGPAELSNLTVGGTAIALPDERLFRIFSFGEDPQVIIPRLSGPEFAVPLRLEAWVHFERSVQAIGRAMATFYRQVQEQIKSKQDNIEQERFVLEAKLRQVQEEIKSKQDKIAALISDSEAMRKELSALRPELESIQRRAWDYKAYRADLTTRFKDRDRRIQEIERSLAWKITKPFWKLERHFKRTPEQIAAAGQLVFALDGPGTWNASCDVFTLKGWCYSPRGPQIVGVRAKVGRKSYFARYGIKREPVAQTALNHPPALHSGFSVDVPVPEGTSSIRLEAIVQGSRWECFLEHPVPPRRDQPQVAARGDGSVQSAGAEPVNLKDSEYRLTPPVLFPGIGSDRVLPTLAPLIEQHRNKVTAANPYFTVITPTFNTLPRWLAEAGASLLSQTFPDWEWCVVDDGSSDQNLRQLLEALGAAHPRFRIKFSTHGGISSACNQGLDLARGKFVCFLDHDDVLDLEALGAMAEKLSEGFDLVYSDEDKLDDQQQKLIAPFFKPDWSPEYFRGAMYVGHLLCVSRDLADRVRFDSDFDGVQDFEFVLRLTETGARVGHIARVLYHWRKSPNSIAEASNAKPHITTLQQKAVNAHLERLGLAARAEPGETPHRLKVLPLPRKSFPLISIIIPTKDSPELLSQCLDSIYQNTTYPRFEVILVDNDTTNSEALAVMRRHPVIRLYMPNPFNFSRANNLSARHARGEYLVCLNNDTEVVTPDWLDHLLYYAEQADVGAVGALLVYAHDAVQHAGVVLGMRGTADHVMRGFGPKVDGYAGALSCAREVSAVTAACMLIRRSLFNEVGGFNEHFFTIYQDLDLCLRLRERGFRIICTPRAKLIHRESVSRKKCYDLVDRFLLLDQWQDAIERGDPYYNPNLNLERGDYTLQSKEA